MEAYKVPTQIFQSRKILFALLRSNLSMRASPTSTASLRMSNARSSSLRNDAVSGQSTIQNFVAAPMTVVARPSMMKIHLNPSYPPSPSMLAKP